jgi:chemotaxis protein CheX
MQVEHINPFLRSVAKTFETMLSCPVRRGSISIVESLSPSHPVSGVIGLSGDAVGIVVLNLSREVALKAASAMLMCDTHEIDTDVIDAVGELANMVAGAAKSELEQFNLSVSLPSVVTGDGHEIHFPSSVKPICVPLASEWGPLALLFGLAPVHAAV